MPVYDYGDDDKDYANVPLATLAALAAPKTHHSTTITKTLSFRIYQAHQNVLISHFRFNFQHQNPSTTCTTKISKKIQHFPHLNIT